MVTALRETVKKLRALSRFVVLGTPYLSSASPSSGTELDER
jgi:hypothetical protein